MTTLPITITVDFVSAGRLSEASPLGAKMGSYTYENTGPNTGTFASTYDDESQCTTDLTFDSTTTGTAVANCSDNVLAPVVPLEWRLIEIPSG